MIYFVALETQASKRSYMTHCQCTNYLAQIPGLLHKEYIEMPLYKTN